MKAKPTLLDHKSKALELYRSFNDSERFGVKFGLFPFDKMPKDEEGYDSKELAVALMQVATDLGKEAKKLWRR